MLKYAFLLFFVSSSLWAKDGKGFVFSVSVSPKVNQSKFERNDNATSTTYTGTRYKASAGYSFSYITLLANYARAESESKRDETHEREDSDYGLTFRFTPIRFLYLQSSYWITSTTLSYSDRATEDFEGEKLTAGAGIRIPTPQGPSFTISANYILSSKMKRKGSSEGNIVDEEGYTINLGGTLAFSY